MGEEGVVEVYDVRDCACGVAVCAGVEYIFFVLVGDGRGVVGCGGGEEVVGERGEEGGLGRGGEGVWEERGGGGERVVEVVEVAGFGEAEVRGGCGKVGCGFKAGAGEGHGVSLIVCRVLF